MIVRAGYYAQLAMSCASQSRLQSLENRKELQNLFVETIDKLADKKKKSNLQTTRQKSDKRPEQKIKQDSLFPLILTIIHRPNIHHFDNAYLQYLH